MEFSNTDYCLDEIRKLKLRVAELEKDNLQLRTVLKESGISSTSETFREKLSKYLEKK